MLGYTERSNLGLFGPLGISKWHYAKASVGSAMDSGFGVCLRSGRIARKSLESPDPTEARKVLFFYLFLCYAFVTAIFQEHKVRFVPLIGFNSSFTVTSNTRGLLFPLAVTSTLGTVDSEPSLEITLSACFQTCRGFHCVAPKRTSHGAAGMYPR